MHRKFGTLALTSLLTLGMAAGAAFAQDQSAPPSPPPNMQGHRGMDPDTQLKRLTKQLDLSADQQSQIKPILDSRQQQMQQLWQDQSMSRDDRHQKMTEIQSDTTNKIEAVLNDTQKQKYEAMQAEMKQRMMQRQQGGAAPPPQGSTPPSPQ
jgi:Spy/CpxP family protein refolding chaperone